MDEQNIILKNRNELQLTGIEKLVSIKTSLVQLNTILGGIIIEGKNMELVNLNNEKKEIIIKGEISSLKYTSLNQNFLRKIFK